MSDEKYRITMASIFVGGFVATFGLWLFFGDREQQRMIENGYEEEITPNAKGYGFPTRHWVKRSPSLVPGRN